MSGIGSQSAAMGVVLRALQAIAVLVCVLIVRPAGAVAEPPTIVFDLATPLTGTSFQAILQGSFPGDLLLALDVTVVYDSARVSFQGYATASALTNGFVAVPTTLTLPTASLVQGGLLSAADGGVLIKANFTAASSSVPVATDVRFFGTLGLDLADEVSFDVTRQITMLPAAVPEPALWLTLLLGLGVVASCVHAAGVGTSGVLGWVRLR